MEQRQSGHDDSVEAELLRHLNDIRGHREGFFEDVLGAVANAGRYALPGEPCLDVLLDFYFDALRLLPYWSAAVFRRLSDSRLGCLFGVLPAVSEGLQTRDHVCFGLKRWADDPSQVDLTEYEPQTLRGIRRQLREMSNEEWMALGWMMRERLANDGALTFKELRHRVSEEIRATNSYPTLNRGRKQRADNA